MHGEDVDIDADGEPDIDAVQQPYRSPEVKPRVTLRLNRSEVEMARSVVDGVPGRRNLRPRKSSGSEYSAGNRSASGSGSSHGDVNMRMGGDGEEEEQKPVKVITTSSGRRTAQTRSYIESEEDPDEDPAVNLFSSNDNVTHYTRSRAKSVTTTTTHTFRQQTLVTDDEEDVGPVRATRSRSKKLHHVKENGDDAQELDLLEQDHRPNQRLTRSRLSRMKKSRRKDEDDIYDAGDHEDQPGSSEYDEADHTSPEPEPEPDLDADGDIDVDADGEPDDGANGEILDGGDGKPYAFRRRTKQINYAIPPPLEEIRPAKGPSKPNKGKGRAGPGWSANGTELARYMGGLPADDSVSTNSG